MNSEPFVIERTYHVPAATVWKAITDTDDMKQWYFNLEAFKPEVGFEFRFKAGADKDNQYLHVCKITEVIPAKKLTYSWRYDGYKGKSLVTFELSDQEKQTTLKLTHTGLETFPMDKREFARKSFAAGWTYILATSLDNFLHNRIST